MVRREIQLFGRELVLHQRFASDVLAVIDMPNETQQEQINILLIGVSAALKENWLYLKGRKRKKIEAELSPLGLAQKLSIQKILELWNQVVEIEGLADGSADGAKKK
jgi:hypothetical protein